MADKIINMIRMPPINSKKKIKGNHTSPLFVYINIKIAPLVAISVILILIGFLLNMPEKNIRILIIKINVFIFLSLFKTSILDIENLGKIVYVSFLFLVVFNLFFFS